MHQNKRKRMLVRIFQSLAVITFVGWFGTATATAVLYTDRTAFNAAVTAAGILTTSNSFETSFTAAQTVDFGDFSVTSSDSAQDVTSNTSYPTDGSRSVQVDPTATFSFDSGINAFGIDIIDFGDGGQGEYPADLLLSGFGFTEHTLATSDGGNSDGNVQFFGVIDTMATETVIVLRSTDEFDALYFDALVYGSVPESVPEPTTLLLMGLGLAGIGYRRKKAA